MLPPIIAYDTETDRLFNAPDRFWRFEEYEELQTAIVMSTQTVLVQVCSVSASSPEEVILFEGDDAIAQFLRAFEDTPYDVDCHAFNLGKYEYRWLKYALIDEGFEPVRKPIRKKALPAHSFCIFGDNQFVYSMWIKSSTGHIMTITDDKRRMAGETMRSCAEMIRKKYPSWFRGIDEVKLHVETYNDGWYYAHNGYDEFIRYSIQDAYSQALIARYILQSGMNDSLTAQGWAMKEMLCTKYKNDHDASGAYFAKLTFQKKYPPLDRDMQDIVEHNMMGGFVWGKVGDWHGHFCHGDYKSSYPYEYYKGKLFIGSVCRTTDPNSQDWRIGTALRFKHWYLVSFDFELKETGIPSLTGAQCGHPDQHTKKAREGHCERILLDEVLFEEIGESYTLSNVHIHELWYARRCEGGFEDTTRIFFDRKEAAEKGTLEKTLAKLCLNGAQHGKTITKTNRRNRFVDPDSGEDAYENVVNDPDYCALIGFTGMQLARARLLRHCRLLKEAGYEIYMCDTDSFVTDALPEEAERIIGYDAFIHEGDKGMDRTLGKIEWEEDAHSERVFDHFKCWGLKMYLEECNGEYRKSAFRGMHDDLQRTVLKDAATDGTIYSYIQSGTVHIPWGVTIAPVIKHFHAEDVWMEDHTEEDLERIREMCYRQTGKLTERHGCKEDIRAYLKDSSYGEEDYYYGRAFIKKMLDEMRYDYGDQ